MEIGNLIDQLEKAVNAARGNKSQTRFEMAAELDCLARFLQVMGQAYESIYIVLLRITLISQDDITKGRLDQIEHRIDQLDATGVGFDIDVIANRLRSMHEGRAKSLRPIMEHEPTACDWHMLLGAMDERDTPLINEIYNTTSLLRRLLTQLRRDPSKLAAVHAAVVQQAVEVRGGLEKCQWLLNSILGLSTVRFTAAPGAKRPQTQPLQHVGTPR